jgi:hypothetical protein
VSRDPYPEEGASGVTGLGALLVLGSIIAGLALVLATTPIVGRGDYGQWLMTARYYLGEPVPDYRTISALPPLVPILLSVISRILPDPAAALETFNVLMLVGVILGFYLAGSALFESRIAGLLAVATGLLVTDRFIELFAFGGLLQASAITFMSLSVAAFVRAGRGPGLERRWWILGSGCLALATLSHVGTGLIAVPVALSVGLLSLLRLNQFPWRTRINALLPVGIVLAALSVYWLVVLLPAGGEYVTNPASLNYRGADRLFTGLFSYWPTALVVGLGTGAVVLGSLGELQRRTVGSHLVLLLWCAVAWGVLLLSVITGAATDYPRFATPLLVPLVLAAASGLLWLGRSLAVYLGGLMPRPSQQTVLFTTAALFIVSISPFAAEKYASQATTYQPRDAQALSTLTTWIDGQLPAGEAVLTEVREGKWIEGQTGRPALFSLPVRYSFRPAEWERAIAATALLQSTGSIANQFFFAKFSDGDPCTADRPPSAFTLAINHGGEFVDALRLSTGQIRILAANPAGSTLASVSSLTAATESVAVSPEDVTIHEAWRGKSGSADLSYTQSIRLISESSTFDLSGEVKTKLPLGGLEIDLVPIPGMAITAVDGSGGEADVYFTQMGLLQPHLRVVVAGNGASVELTAAGSLRIHASSSRLHLLITDLSASNHYSSDLRLLCAAQLRDAYHVGAVLLVRDPTYPARMQRAEALGFRLVRTLGPYVVMLRAGKPG